MAKNIPVWEQNKPATYFFKVVFSSRISFKWTP